MKKINLSITIGILLTGLLVGGIAFAPDSLGFNSVTSDGTLEAPKLTVYIDGNEVTLLWTRVDGATDYVVHYAQYPYDNPDTIKTIVGHHFIATYELSPGSAYHIAVIACKDSGSDCSDYSNIHTVNIPLVSTYKNSLGQEFKLIPAGTFTMGSPPNDNPLDFSFPEEKPQHQVTLTQPFYLQTTEVTQAQWESVMGKNPSHFRDCSTCPVETVSWNDVQSYIAKMNKRGEGTYSLPTEAQWEYAVRAGSTTELYNGAITSEYPYCDYDPNQDAIAWVCNNSGDKTHPVAQKTPNAWGLYDMLGNVWEWSQDWYDSKYYTSSAVTDPTGPSSGVWRVLRGGGWATDVSGCRSACRLSQFPETRIAMIGFRLLRQP